jgi:branched-chain amino acid transport system substrate-binding protein
LRRLKFVAIACVAAATLGLVAIGSGPAGAGSKSDKTLYCISAWETTGESSQAIPNFEDGAQLAIKDLEKKGWTVEYERIPGSATSAASQEEVFLAAEAKNPDCWMGLTSSAVFIPVGPKIAATDLPVFAFASPSQGVKSGSAGGDNIFLVRPLNDQTYAKLLQYACEELGAKKIGLSLVTGAFGDTTKQIVDDEIGQYKNCEVVTEQSNSPTANDLTQQALAFKDADVDAILSANYPNPMGVLVNQLRQNGVTVPFLGGASLNIANDSGALQSTENLVVIDDCVPDASKDKAAKKFTKKYIKEYGYPPNYASAQTYDALHMAANAVDKAGHDYAAINKALAGTKYNGVCKYENDTNNILANSVTIYEYTSDGGKKIVKTYPIEFTPNEALETATTTTAAAG